MKNALDYGVVGDGVTDDTAAIQALVASSPARETLYFPTGHYKLSGTIDCGTKGLTIKGDGKGRPQGAGYNGGSAFVGSVAGPLWKVQYPASGVDFLDLGFSNSNPAGTALWVGGNSIVIERVSIWAWRGIWAPANTFTVGIKNVQIVWAGNTAGSIGIQTAGHTSIQAVDVVGFEEGIRACGLGVDIRSARIEVNKIGMALGRDANGTTSSLTGAVIEAISMEANDTGVLIYSSSASTFRGITIRGSANAPSGMSAYGLQVNSANTADFVGDIANGEFTGAAIRVLTQFGSTRWALTSASNTLIGNPLYPAAKAWDTPPGNFIYEQSNRP